MTKPKTGTDVYLADWVRALAAAHEQQRADLKRACELLREWNKIESTAEADIFEDSVHAFLAEQEGKQR